LILAFEKKCARKFFDGRLSVRQMAPIDEREAFRNLLASGELSTVLGSEDGMAKELHKGDRVAWRSSGGGSVGSVERKLTSPGKIKGHEVAASPDNPEYLVRSEKSGKIAAHKPTALRRVQ
jgi:Hypervirulence associated proteins TUDOR domain